jgi:outer membrane lipoprotein carrier protein
VRAAILALLLAGPPGPTQSGSPALELLAKAAAAYGDGSAHAAAFTQIYTPAGFATSKRESGRVWIQAPQRLRFDYAAPDAKIYTYDAGEGRFFSPEDKQLAIRKLTPDERARLPLVFLERPEDLAARFDVATDASGAVLLKPRSPDSDLAWLKLVVNGAGMLDSLSYEDTAGNRSEFRFEGWKAEKARPAEDYRIVGPKGTRIVEN